VLCGIRPRLAVSPLRLREAPLAEGRVAAQRTGHALDLDDVEPDLHR
jgi:hypothetical protein